MTRSATRVDRVRLHVDDADGAHARLKLGNLLAGADLRPAGLAPSAVLCVRRLADPIPGLLRLNAGDARPPPEWERGVVDSLERALRTAARPAREPVGAAAEAVLFADRAEFLACLARDAADGSAWTRWWWTGVRARAARGGDPVVSAWLATPEHVPAALELLADRGDATVFVHALPPAAASEITTAVTAAFGLSSASPSRPVTAAGRDASDDVGSEEPAAGAAAAPWQAHVPEASDPALAATSRLLLGVALSLRRSPTAARSPAFAAAVRRWYVAARLEAAEPRTAAAREPTTAAPARPGSSRRHDAPRDGDGALARHGVDSEATVTPRATSERTDIAAPRHPRAGPYRSLPLRRHRIRPAADRPPPPSDEHLERRHAQPASYSRPVSRETADAGGRANDPSGAREAPSPRRPSSASTRPKPPVGTVAVDTELGGVFYLLNLTLYLGLYGDFTQPRKPGIALDPWDLLALLAPRLLVDRIPDDRLWHLLARLARRDPRDPPGRGFRPPVAWRTPAAWLEPFDPAGAWHWSAAHGALRILHPAGFPVAAVPRTQASPRTQLAQELRRLRPPRPISCRSALTPEPARPLARWAARLAAYSDARLRRALGLGPAAALDRALLRRRARVLVSPTHVDVVLRLAELPLEVRFAGLDRTPGWIPATGRFVALHFE